MKTPFIAVAVDGSWLATIGADDAARIWDTASSQERAVIGSYYINKVTALAHHRDGTWLALTSESGALRIINPATGHTAAVIRVDGALKNCRWSPDGQSLLAVSEHCMYEFTFSPGASHLPACGRSFSRGRSLAAR